MYSGTKYGTKYGTKWTPHDATALIDALVSIASAGRKKEKNIIYYLVLLLLGINNAMQKYGFHHLSVGNSLGATMLSMQWYISQYCPWQSPEPFSRTRSAQASYLATYFWQRGLALASIVGFTSTGSSSSAIFFSFICTFFFKKKSRLKNKIVSLSLSLSLTRQSSYLILSYPPRVYLLMFSNAE